MKKEQLGLNYVEQGRLTQQEMNEIFGGYFFCSPYCAVEENGIISRTCGIYEECTSTTNKKNLCTSPSNGSYAWLPLAYREEGAISQNTINSLLK